MQVFFLVLIPQLSLGWHLHCGKNFKSSGDDEKYVEGGELQPKHLRLKEQPSTKHLRLKESAL